MKKLLSILLVSLLFTCIFTGCGEQALTLNTADVTKIAITNANSSTIVLDKNEDVTSLLLAIQNASCITSGVKQEELPALTYQFTTYKDTTPVNTMILYGNEYLQVDTVLYKGNLADAAVILDGHAKVSDVKDLSPVFSAKANEITEIAFYNVTKNTFKIITVEKDIESIISPLQALRISDKGTSGEITEQLALYVRLKDTNEYLPAVEINRYETGTMCSAEGKSVQVSNYNWNVLYEKLEYNTMPIKK